MPWAFPKPLITSFLSLVVVFNLSAQTASSKESSLHAVGIKTVRAIAMGNADYLLSIVDHQGISVGNEGDKQSAAAFRGDLVKHVGVYCELFDHGCKTDDNNPNRTLGHAFNSAGDPLNANLRFKVDGDHGTLEYWEPGQGDLVATFSYRFVGGKWYLGNIHFV